MELIGLIIGFIVVVIVAKLIGGDNRS